MQEESTSTPRKTESSKATLCVKCEHLCSPDIERCDRCGAHLYVLCSHCRHKNARVVSRCGSCKRRLHKSVKDRIRHSKSGGLNFLYLGGAILVVVVSIVLIIWLADIRLW